jgi:hypothetical protein
MMLTSVKGQTGLQRTFVKVFEVAQSLCVVLASRRTQSVGRPTPQTFAQCFSPTGRYRSSGPS